LRLREWEDLDNYFRFYLSGSGPRPHIAPACGSPHTRCMKRFRCIASCLLRYCTSGSSP